MNPFEFDLSLQRPVFAMMRRGIRVDTTLRAQHLEEAHEKWTNFQTLLNEVATHPINTSSFPQMKKFLYSELGLPLRKKRNTKGVISITTDEDALRSLMAFSENKVRTLVQEEALNRWRRIYTSLFLALRIRHTRKKIESYLECEIDSDDRVRCTMTIGGAETMRFSHSKTIWDTGMNLATVPHPERKWCIADEGMELAEFDLNRGESWVYAHLSEDPELMRIHLDGEDFHSETASIIQSAFGDTNLSPDEIRKLAKSGDSFGYRIRFLGKKVNHASAYRMGPFRAAEVVNQESDETNITVTPTQMKKAGELWFTKYPGIQEWWNWIDNEVETKRELVTPYGRRRQFFGFMSEHLKKEATAYVPQSTSVDYLNKGMLRVYDEMVTKSAFDLELLHQNHDSILVQYPIHHRNSVHSEVISRLESTIEINGHQVTIPVESSYGQNWGDYHKDNNPNGLREWDG